MYGRNKEDIEYAYLFKVLSSARCAKRPVAAGTYVGGVFVWDVNECTRHKAPGEIETCARLAFKDEDSEEALAACSPKHAERNLVWRLGGAQSDGVAWVVGHYFACRPCAAALRSIGVKEIRVKELP